MLFPNEESLPPPMPAAEWDIVEDAGGDQIMAGLHRSYEENETAWQQTLEGKSSGPSAAAAEDRYLLARWGLTEAMAKRRLELRQKRSHDNH